MGRYYIIKIKQYSKTLVVNKQYSKITYDYYKTNTVDMCYNCGFDDLQELYRFCIVNEIKFYEVIKVLINSKEEKL